MLKKILCTLFIGLSSLYANNVDSAEYVTEQISIDLIMEDIKKESFIAGKIGYKETIESKVELLDWTKNEQYFSIAADKIINTSSIYGKPISFFITLQNKEKNLISYTCIIDSECEKCNATKEATGEQISKTYICQKIKKIIK